MPAAAAALIFDENGRVLLIQEGYGLRRFGLPGGVIESGETPGGAVVREVREEVGIEVEIEELIAVYHLVSDRGEGLRFAFRCRVVTGEPTLPASGEIAAIVWALPGDLPQPMTHTAPLAISDALKRRAGAYREIDARTRRL